MGSRFLATEECIVHPAYKEWMVQGTESDLTIIGRSVGMKSRVIKNKATLEIIEKEAKGASADELRPLFEQKTPSVMRDGDVVEGRGGCGQVVGLVHSVVSVKELIDSMVDEARTLRKRLDSMLPAD